MGIAKTAISIVLPALIVAARFLVPGSWTNDYTWFFAVTGFITTIMGCGAGALLSRRYIAQVSTFGVVVLSVVVALVLLAFFETMPSWPFAGAGFVVAWLLMALGYTAVLLFGVSRDRFVRRFGTVFFGVSMVTIVPMYWSVHHFENANVFDSIGTWYTVVVASIFTVVAGIAMAAGGALLGSYREALHSGNARTVDA